MNLQEKKDKYLSLCHAMQSGVAYKMQSDSAETSPKHLRVGVNSAQVQHAALVKLLCEKGIITEEEYLDALIEMMEREVQAYQDELSRIYGTNITLG